MLQGNIIEGYFYNNYPTGVRGKGNGYYIYPFTPLPYPSNIGAEIYGYPKFTPIITPYYPKRKRREQR